MADNNNNQMHKSLKRTHDEDYDIYCVLVAKGVPVLVKTAWVSSFLGVSITALMEWRKKGIGPKWHRFGKTIRYDFADLLDYFQNGEQRPPKEFPTIE